MNVIGKIIFEGEVVLSINMDVSEEGDLDVLAKTLIDEFVQKFPDKSILNNNVSIKFDHGEEG